MYVPEVHDLQGIFSIYFRSIACISTFVSILLIIYAKIKLMFNIPLYFLFLFLFILFFFN